MHLIRDTNGSNIAFIVFTLLVELLNGAFDIIPPAFGRLLGPALL